MRRDETPKTTPQRRVLRTSNNNMLINVDIEPLSDDEQAKVDAIFAVSND